MATKNNGKGNSSMCFIFKNYISAGYPLLWVTTHEETRALTVLTTEATACSTPRKVYGWSCVDGVRQYSIQNNALATSTEITASNPDNAQEKVPLISMDIMFQWAEKLMSDNSIIVLKDFHHFIKSDASTLPQASRFIRNLLNSFKSKGKMIVLMSPTTAIPLELDKETTKVDFKLPVRDELKLVLQAVCNDAGLTYPKDDAGLIDAALGLTASEAENAFSLSLAENKGKFDQDVIAREKASIVKKSHVLEVMNTGFSLSDIGGLDSIKEWLDENANVNTVHAKAFGIKPAKGMLLMGVPGTGKSLTAKAIAQIWHRPLLRMDIGNIFDGHVGGSEGNMHSALSTAAACAPCVLFIDELEKAFAGTAAGDYTGDSGTAKRLFGTMLSWMQDRQEDVFIVATANSVKNLAAEFLRPGRFDALFWVDVPTHKERIAILTIHIGKAKQDPKDVDLGKVAQACRGFTGAEIEVLVQYALKRAFRESRDSLKTEDFLANVKRITPIIHGPKAGAILEERKSAVSNGVVRASKDTYEEDIPAPVAESMGRKMDISNN